MTTDQVDDSGRPLRHEDGIAPGHQRPADEQADHGAPEAATLIAPVITVRHPEMTPDQVNDAALRFARIGVDPTSLRYQIDHGLIR